MKKTLLILLLAIGYAANCQEVLTDKINDQLSAQGCGVAFVTITYSSGTYTSTESDILIKDSATTSLYIHAVVMDSNRAPVDTIFTLSSGELTGLNSFYSAAASNSNPNPTLSIVHSGTAKLTIEIGCARTVDVTYTTTNHICLYRTLVSNWNKWYQ